MSERFFGTFWFLNSFGCPEEPGSVHKEFEVRDDGDCVLIKAKANGRVFRTGKLELRSVSSFDTPKSEKRGSLSIVHGHGSLSSPPQWTDIVYSVNHPEFEGATFQVFSGFNCLAIPETLIEDATQEVVTNYVYDEDDSAAQVSVATGPSSIYRVYFGNHPVNLIENVPVAIEDGVAFFDEDEVALKRINHDWSNLDNYKVGLQTQCPVIVKKDGQLMSLVEKQKQVHLVFCSALSYLNFPSCPTAYKISQYMAEAQIKATILAACENCRRFPGKPGSNKLFLRPLGVNELYDNPVVWTTRAIIQCKSLIEQSGLDIFFICEDDEVFTEAYSDLRSLIQELGGSVIETVKVKDEEELQNEKCCVMKKPLLFVAIVIIGLVIALLVGSRNIVKL